MIFGAGFSIPATQLFSHFILNPSRQPPGGGPLGDLFFLTSIFFGFGFDFDFFGIVSPPVCDDPGGGGLATAMDK